VLQKPDGQRRYKRRNRIEITFGRLTNWRRVAIRYDRWPAVFFSAIALAAIVIVWRDQRVLTPGFTHTSSNVRGGLAQEDRSLAIAEVQR